MLKAEYKWKELEAQAQNRVQWRGVKPTTVSSGEGSCPQPCPVERGQAQNVSSGEGSLMAYALPGSDKIEIIKDNTITFGHSHNI